MECIRRAGLEFKSNRRGIAVHQGTSIMTLDIRELKLLGFVPIETERDAMLRVSEAQEILSEVCAEEGVAYRKMVCRSEQENGLEWVLVIMIFGDPREWKEDWITNRVRKVRAEKIWAELGDWNTESSVIVHFTDKCKETRLCPVSCIMEYGDPREWS